MAIGERYSSDSIKRGKKKQKDGDKKRGDEKKRAEKRRGGGGPSSSIRRGGKRRDPSSLECSYCISSTFKQSERTQRRRFRKREGRSNDDRSPAS